MSTAPRPTPKKTTKQPKAPAGVQKAEPTFFSWRKLSAAKWGDSWLERLSFLGPTRVMLIEFPNAPKVRVEAHGLKRAEADDLLKMFGGQISAAKPLILDDQPPRPPIRIREKLLIVTSEKERDAAMEERSSRRTILVPAGMAFGTGEHATTVTCLRLLADVSDELEGTPWEVLDLGTGTGILAIAARALGAKRAEAHDFDPHAVRTAKENVRVNGIDKLVVKRLDIRKWQPTRTWDVVIANLFSGLLIESAAKIAQVMARDGRLIFSGVLRSQEAEVVAAFKKNGLGIDRIVRRGKWIAGLAGRRPARRK